LKRNSFLFGGKESKEIIKRLFDFVVALTGLFFTWPIILLSGIFATIDIGAGGFFTQTRVGRHGQIFKVIKIRTMRNDENISTSITGSDDPRITRLGRWLRRMKLDELPQLVNILLGQMSFVGPRPDVPGFADKLRGDDRIILELRPGITGPATLKYRNEEEIVAEQDDPEAFNRTVIWPDKVRINKEYANNYSLSGDLRIILETITGSGSVLRKIS
jgi:lipopolysaccharide/colanic/teichoic acid biosynthesis glycosyltransferase